MLSRLSLRLQLLTSYLLLLSISLGVISVALLLFLSTRQAPPQPTYQRLATLIRGTGTTDVLHDFNLRQRDFPSDDNRITTLLDGFAISRGVRVIGVIRTEGRPSIVFYDSTDTYQNRDRINLRDDNYVDTGLQKTLLERTRQVYGEFRDPDGSEWLYGGIGVPSPSPRGNMFIGLILAEPRPTASLQAVLNEFSSALLPPLLQAGLIGLLVAVGLAIIISRGIARPLQALSKATEAVSRGDYHHTVLESGPPEIRSVARAFNQMSSDVRSAQQSQREFLASVSHDLKTPLTSIQGYSQAIIDGATSDPAAAAEVIYEEAGRLNRMVVELTDLMRMQSGRLSLELTALDVSEMANAIGERLSVVARKKNITVHVDTMPVPPVAGDGDRMAQVFTNLVSNAIKYTPSGGDVWLSTRSNHDGVEISVRDNGAGIPKKDLDRIFERFYQVDKARGPHRGTGLGLAITREIVMAHGGTISVQSDGQNRGSTFTVWLPSPHLSTIISRSVLPS